VQAGETPELTDTLEPLFKAIVEHIPPPSVYPDAPLQLLVTNIDYDDHKGRICIARINAGTLSTAQTVSICRSDTETCTPGKVTEVFVYKDFAREKVESASAGDIVAIAGAP
jgi:GTP-binding protein